EAQKAYLAYVEALRAEGLKVETGSFGAHMRVRLTNDGPATFWLKF
ncbi:D-aminoacyl-tRNA deacylase, partial [Sutterella wadsworthensis]